MNYNNSNQFNNMNNYYNPLYNINNNTNLNNQNNKNSNANINNNKNSINNSGKQKDNTNTNKTIKNTNKDKANSNKNITNTNISKKEKTKDIVNANNTNTNNNKESKDKPKIAASNDKDKDNETKLTNEINNLSIKDSKDLNNKNININNEIKLDEIDTDVYSKEGKLSEVDETRDPASIVFIGHVDHGKSTICGNILQLTGQVDDRTLEKYQKLAKEKNRESWYMAYLMDQNDEEREKGKTVEIGKAYFQLEKKRFTILDAPGHKGYLPNLLLGACQADYAGLVVSAKDGEFEGGFEKGGSTKEHALLAKSLGVGKLVILVNKMDEETVKWSETRFYQIKSSIGDYLKKIGYKEEDFKFVPISGLYGDNMKNPISSEYGQWYREGTLFEILNNLAVPQRNVNGPLRFSILDRYKDGGMQVLGKVESGTLIFNQCYYLMPTKANVEVQWIFNEAEQGIPYAKAGESVRLKIKGAENENEVQRGYILCNNENPCPAFNNIIAEIQLLEMNESKPVMTSGFDCVIHYHTNVSTCNIEKILGEIDKKTKEEKKATILKNYSRARVNIKINDIVCGDKFENNQYLGRFTLRHEERTIAVGKVLKYKDLK